MKRAIDIKALKEQYMPIVLFCVVTIASIIVAHYFDFTSYNDVFDNILDATINFNSIIIGFVGVLIGILFSLRDSHIVSLLFKHNKEQQLKRYFLEAIISGVVLLLFSAGLYLRNVYPINTIMCYLISIWCGLLVYSGACYYRIIMLMVNIVFIRDEDVINYDFSNSESAKEIQEAFSNK